MWTMFGYLKYGSGVGKTIPLSQYLIGLIEKIYTVVLLLQITQPI